MRIFAEETFGPSVNIVEVASTDEAIGLANSSGYVNFLESHPARLTSLFLQLRVECIHLDRGLLPSARDGEASRVECCEYIQTDYLTMVNLLLSAADSHQLLDRSRRSRSSSRWTQGLGIWKVRSLFHF